MPIERICQNCAQLFLTQPTYVRQGIAKYCSKACYNAARYCAITCICQHCSNSFLRNPGDVKQERGLYCSKQCKHDAQRGPRLPLSRLWEKVERCEHGIDCIYCCWNFIGSLHGQGYGQMAQGRRLLRAHRIAWELWNNQLMPPEFDAAHYCHNRKCCNPDHIHKATHKENMEESARDHHMHPGSRNHTSKLVETDIPVIMTLYASGETQKHIAELYHVHPSTIGAIVTNRTWRHMQRL